MSLALSGDTVAYLMSLGLSAEEMKGLIDRLHRDALAVAPVAASSGINEERERLRNESTYAERKRAKDRARQAAIRELARQHRESRGESPAIHPAIHDDPPATACDAVGDPATTGDASRVHVVNTTLPSEEVITPLRSPSESFPPKSKRPSRKAPAGWRPSEATFEKLAEEGFSAGDLERALTRMRDHEFRTPRSDWDGTFRNWVRRDADFTPTPRQAHAQRPDDRREARNRIWSEIAAEEGGSGAGVPALPGRGRS